MDSLGNMRIGKAFDLSGKPTTTIEGWSIEKISYDKNGNYKEISYYDANGNPALHKEGYYEIKYERDNRGRIIKQMYFDRSGKPTIFKKSGCYGVVYTYDDETHNNIYSQTCLGPDQKPVINFEKWAVWKGKYDDKNRLIMIPGKLILQLTLIRTENLLTPRLGMRSG